MSKTPGKKKFMRTLLVLICSLALASLALGAQEEKKKEQPKRKPAQTAAQPVQKEVSTGSKQAKQTDQSRKKKEEYLHEQQNKVKTSRGPLEGQTGEPGNREKVTRAGKPAQVATTPTTGARRTAATGKPQHFN